MSWPPFPRFGKIPASTKRYLRWRREVEKREAEFDWGIEAGVDSTHCYWYIPKARMAELLRVRPVVEAIDWSSIRD